MTITELDNYFRVLLNIDAFCNIDGSKNGLQVACSEKQIKKIAFAVDACLENFQKAAKLGADAIFVHHGLFWTSAMTITNQHYERIKTLIQNDIALFGVHLPLDAHNKYGNNIGIAHQLQLQDIKPFGWYKGTQIGYKGMFSESSSSEGLTIEEILQRLFPEGQKPNAVLPFGKTHIKTVGVISGGAGDDVHQAISENLDCFITGEINHELYHTILENKISVIAGGHYQTETFGVKLVSEQVKKELGIETFFLETPTQL